MRTRPLSTIPPFTNGDTTMPIMPMTGCCAPLRHIPAQSLPKVYLLMGVALSHCPTRSTWLQLPAMRDSVQSFPPEPFATSHRDCTELPVVFTHFKCVHKHSTPLQKAAWKMACQNRGMAVCIVLVHVKLHLEPNLKMIMHSAQTSMLLLKQLSSPSRPS